MTKIWAYRPVPVMVVAKDVWKGKKTSSKNMQCANWPFSKVKVNSNKNNIDPAYWYKG